MWHVSIVEEGESDLPQLKRASRANYEWARSFMVDLESDPESLGEPCERPPLSEDCRKVYFGNQRDHRIVWRIIPDENPSEDFRGEVDVLILGYKGRDSSFYEEVEARYLASKAQRQEAGGANLDESPSSDPEGTAPA